jgi:hypothetical protein
MDSNKTGTTGLSAERHRSHPKMSEPSEPRLMIVRYFHGAPAVWECSVCRELFSVLSVAGVYVGFEDILAIFQEHGRAEHPSGESSE